jgi:hypothetical protein
VVKEQRAFMQQQAAAIEAQPEVAVTPAVNWEHAPAEQNAARETHGSHRVKHSQAESFAKQVLNEKMAQTEAGMERS